MKRIEGYKIIVRGVEWPEYFQGCGISCTRFDDVATGVGNSVVEAAEDAMEQLAQGDWDTESNPELLAELEGLDEKDLIEEWMEENDIDEEEPETPYVYVSIRVK